MSSAGHSWTVSTTVDTSLTNLLKYDAIFLTSYIDVDVLASYINSGGNVYLPAGTTSTPSALAAIWNPFLNQFGLDMSDNVNGLRGTYPISSAHPLLNGVNSLYFDRGNFISELNPSNPNTDIIEYYGSDGVIAIYDSTVPIPGAIWLLGSGLIGLIGIRRKFAK